jgi:hypothetical protein
VLSRGLVPQPGRVQHLPHLPLFVRRVPVGPQGGGIAVLSGGIAPAGPQIMLTGRPVPFLGGLVPAAARTPRSRWSASSSSNTATSWASLWVNITPRFRTGDNRRIAPAACPTCGP